MCQDCLTATLPISPPRRHHGHITIIAMQSFSRFLANNGNSSLPLDGHFVHQQSVIQYLQRWRGPSVNLRTIQTLKSWPLRIAPAHNQVGEGARLLQQKPIDWLWNACGRNTTKQRKPLKSVLRGCRAMTIIILVIYIMHTYIHTYRRHV